MATSDLHGFYKGVGNSVVSTSSLPLQTLQDTKKNKAWRERNMDALESIGIAQLAENVHFKDLYAMLSGKLVMSDYGISDNGILDQVRGLGDDIGIPTFVKHYDFIGILVRKLVGEWLKQKDYFKIDSVDEISENDFIRERTRRTQEFALETFRIELERALLEMGVNTTKQDFKTEDEKNQYLQMLEAEKNKLISPELIEKELSKNFKTKAAEWAEHVLEQDQKKHDLDKLDKSEMEDFLLTGRFFRHYYVGYDYYKPERWSPLETFFSKDVNAENPQDGEYVGRVFYLSVSDIVKRYGHLMSAQQIKDINRKFGEATGNAPYGSEASNFKQRLDAGMFGQVQTVPFQNYYDYELGLQFQDALGIPMGETVVDTPDGETRVPSWLHPFQSNNYIGYAHSQLRRDDILVRTDLLQITEGYWRSWKKMWFINYTTLNGVQTTEIVTDEILPEFIEEYGLKKISTKSLSDLKRGVLEANTMYEFYIPEIWKGIKINAGHSFLTEDIYLDIEPLPYQIKGDSNVFDVKLPVAGIISNSMAQKIRPFQVGYNICLNQIFNLLEKEIGMFFLFDINFLPSEYKDHGTIEESLEKLHTLAKEIGFVPLDTKKQNLEGAQNMNTFMVQDVSFDKQINSRIQLSQYYYNKALEQIGFTPERMGQVTTYQTATGIQQGVDASYDSTADIFTDMSSARKKAMELHLAIAQYCQKEYIDVDFVFTGSDGDKHYINLTDPDFPLRRLGLIPQNDPKQRRNLETLKQAMLQNNTMGADVLLMAETFFSDSTQELVSIARRNRIDTDKKVEEQRQHEQTLMDKQLQAQANEKEAERQFKATESEKDRVNRIKVEEIDSLGRAADKQSDSEGYQRIQEAAQQSVNNSYKERELSVKESLAENKMQIEQSKLDKTAEELRLRAEEIAVKREAIQASKENSFRNSIDKNLKN